MKPKIKIVHLLCKPTQPRELASVESLAPLDGFGIKYVQHCNKPTHTFPIDALHCRRPEALAWKPKDGKLWPGQYGAWQAHHRALRFEFTDDTDFLMIAECDCILTVPHDVFAREVFDTADWMSNREVDYVSFGGHNVNETFRIDPNPEGWSIVSHIFKTHCIMFRRETRDFVLQSFYEKPWDNIDFWYNYVYRGEGRIAIHNSVLARQWEGGSLVDPHKNIKLA